MARELNIISADSHVVEPVDLWQKYLDRNFRERAPRVARRDGIDYWVIEGMADKPMSLPAASAGLPPEKLKMGGVAEEFITGGWDPHARVKDMDTDGVDGEVLYTSKFDVYRIPDPALKRACFRAYNDWLIEYCSAYPDRLYGISLIALDDMDWALAELERTMKAGMRGAAIPCLLGKGRTYGEPQFDAFWAAAQEMNAPLSLHVQTFEGEAPYVSGDYIVDFSAFIMQVMVSIAQFISTGVLERFPGLKLVSAENDIGWAGTYIARMDHACKKHRFRTGSGLGLKQLPSEYFARQVFLTFITDKPGVENRAYIGVDNIMWASDYPHSDSTWPKSQEAIQWQFGDIPEQERDKIIRGNAKKLYAL